MNVNALNVAKDNKSQNHFFYAIRIEILSKSYKSNVNCHAQSDLKILT